MLHHSELCLIVCKIKETRPVDRFIQSKVLFFFFSHFLSRLVCVELVVFLLQGLDVLVIVLYSQVRRRKVLHCVNNNVFELHLFSDLLSLIIFLLPALGIRNRVVNHLRELVELILADDSRGCVDLANDAGGPVVEAF